MCFIKDDSVPVDTENSTHNLVQLALERSIIAVILLKKFSKDVIVGVLRYQFFVCDNAESGQPSKVNEGG